jgi:GH18 family chitinase
MQRSGQGITYIDPEAKVPYFVNPSTKLWVGFDDKASLYTKVRKHPFKISLVIDMI